MLAAHADSVAGAAARGRGVLRGQRAGRFRIWPFLGAALGFHLLLGISLFPAALITAATAFAILGLQRFGFRPFEATIAAIVGFIGVCYLGEIFEAKPPLGTVAHHAVVPQFAGRESVLLAVGILGATVMPHVIYLHSALLQNRIRPETDDQARRLMR